MFQATFLISEKNFRNTGGLPEVHLDPNIFSYSASISACEKASEWQMALRVFRNLSVWDCFLLGQIYIFTAISRELSWILLESASWRHLFLWFLFSKETGMVHTTAQPPHYEHWILQPAKGEISSAHLQPNLLSFSSATSACEKAGEWQRALHLLEAISHARISPDVIIHSVAWYSVGRFFCGKGTGSTPVATVLFHVASDWGHNTKSGTLK